MMKFKFLVIYIILLTGNVFSQSGDLCHIPDFDKQIEKIRSLYYKKHIKKASDLVDSLLQLSKNHQDNKCFNYYNLVYERGNLNIEFDRLGEALITFHDLLDELKNTNFKDLEAHAYLSIALLHELNGKPESCYENLQQANSAILKYKLTEPRTRYYVRLASYYRQMLGNKDLCYENALEAVENIEFAKNHKDIGDAHFLLYACTPSGKKDPSIRQSALQQIERAGDLTGASFLSFSIYNDLMANGHNAEAKQYLEKIKTNYLDKLEENTREKYALLAMYHQRKKMEASEANDKNDVIYHTELQFKNELLAKEKENQSALNRLQDLYLFEKEQKKAKVLEETSKKLYKIIYSTLLILGLVIGFLYFVYRSRVEIKKQKEVIETSMNKIKELNHKNEILLSEVHHRIKNSLQNVISILTIKKARIQDPESKELLSEISNRVNCISLIHEQLYQNEEFEMINTYEYIHKICALHHQISNNNTRSFKYELSIDGAIMLNVDTIMPIGIIVNELITNSQKYAQTGQDPLNLKIEILERAGNNYYFEYCDNGLEAQSHENNKGMGMLLIESLTRQLQTHFHIQTENGYKLSFEFREKRVAAV